ncbi:MAG: DUF3883 domain-containing protein, partial [Candidatus Binatia bacterium]|nr:DUF3883 domain-containing protein [Candidatus Binatia bacterium]
AAEKENVPREVFASCPLLCRKGDVWQYVVHEPRYLNDDNDLANTFADDVWLFHIPVRLSSEAVKYFGVLSLSGSVRVNVTPGEPQARLAEPLLKRLHESLPYVWTWRSSQSKKDAQGLSSRLKRLKVLTVPTLKASLTLGGVHHEVDRRWHVEEDTIYLHEDHVNEAELAQALAKALDVRSEADCYENLLRCADNRQRKEKLLSKGMTDAEIDSCLREFSGPAAEKDHDEVPDKLTMGEQGGGIFQAPSGSGSRDQQHKQSLALQLSGPAERTLSGSTESRKHSLRLKDPSTTPYVLDNPPGGGAGTGGGGEGGSMEWERYSLMGAEKAALEEAGRGFVACELEKRGYSVERMPRDNPGFDLRAKKNGEELRIEVKAHSGRATVVEVTNREYREYLSQQGYRWELWNVEYLAESDARQVAITRYNEIPDDALDTRIFRVDLKKCHYSESTSAAAPQRLPQSGK